MDEFIVEFKEVWSKLPDKAFLFSMLAIWLTLFHFLGHRVFSFTGSPSLFSWMWGAYSAEALDSSHGKLIPLVVLFLLWLKRKQLLEKAGAVWWPGLIGVAFALLLHLFGFMIQQPRISIVALFTGIYALLGVVWGWRFLKLAFFPFTFFIFCIPFGNTLDQLTFPMRLVSTTITWLITNGLLGIPVIQEGTQLIDPDGGYSYEVAAACSGIRSFIPLVVLTLVYGVMTFNKFRNRAVMAFAVIPLTLVCNVLRLVGIVVAHKFIGADAAHFVHEWFGFVTYAIALITVLSLGRWLEEKDTAPTSVEREAVPA